MVPPDLLRGDHSKREVYMCDMLTTTSYLEQDNMIDVSIHGSRVTHICTNEECHDCLSSVWFQDNTRPTADVLSFGLNKTALKIGSTYSTFLSRQWVKKSCPQDYCHFVQNLISYKTLHQTSISYNTSYSSHPKLKQRCKNGMTKLPIDGKEFWACYKFHLDAMVSSACLVSKLS